MDSWLRLLQAAASEDRDGCFEWSMKLGYLTGQENQVIYDALDCAPWLLTFARLCWTPISIPWFCWPPHSGRLLLNHLRSGQGQRGLRLLSQFGQEFL